MMIDGILDQGLDSIVESIEVQSTFGPPIFIREPFREKPAGPTAPGPGTRSGLPGFDLARLLKPKVIVTLRSGGTRVFTPYGEPGPSRWPWVTVGLVAGLGTLTYLAFFKRCRR